MSEAVVGLNLFYPKSSQNQFCPFLKAPEFKTIRNLQNLCHIVKQVWCLFVFNLDGLKLENEIEKLLK